MQNGFGRQHNVSNQNLKTIVLFTCPYSVKHCVSHLSYQRLTKVDHSHTSSHCHPEYKEQKPPILNWLQVHKKATNRSCYHASQALCWYQKTSKSFWYAIWYRASRHEGRWKSACPCKQAMSKGKKYQSIVSEKAKVAGRFKRCTWVLFIFFNV